MGFTWRECHTDSVGLICDLKTMPIRPEVKTTVADIATRDGLIDFSAVNGRVRYKEREFTYECQLESKSRESMNERINAISVFFRHYDGDLILDELPGVVWKARLVNRLDITKQAAHYGSFTLTLLTQPFGTSLTKSIQAFSVSESASYIINNPGTWYTKPVITISGSVSNCAVEVIDNRIAYSGTGELVLDCQKQTAFSGGVNVMPQITGEFPELEPGNNGVLVTGVSGVVEFAFYPTYVWGKVT